MGQIYFRKILFALLIFTGPCFNLLAQGSKMKTESAVIYADASTNVFLTQGSFNMEFQVGENQKESARLYARLGLGAATQFSGPGGIGFPMGLTALFGKRKNHFEIGAGIFPGLANYLPNPGQQAYIYPQAYIGYRFQNPEGGPVFRTFAGILGVGVGLGWAL